MNLWGISVSLSYMILLWNCPIKQWQRIGYCTCSSFSERNTISEDWKKIIDDSWKTIALIISYYRNHLCNLLKQFAFNTYLHKISGAVTKTFKHSWYIFNFEIILISSNWIKNDIINNYFMMLKNRIYFLNKRINLIFCSLKTLYCLFFF